jgi:sterol desaturase/sphingolipid hydroxylase (fatty acid hydroxylase superfamily)
VFLVFDFLSVLPAQMRDPVLFAVPFFLLLLILEWTAARRLEDLEPASYQRRDAWASISMGLVSVATTAGWKFLALLGYAALYAYVAPWHLSATRWYTWVIAIVGVDLLFYLYHRLAHRVRLIWATHQAHHSSQYFNFATALRQKWNNSGEILMWIPLPLLGIPPWMVFLAFSINLIYQFWVHTERIDKLWAPVEPPGAPRHGPGVPGQELRWHLHHLGPGVRLLSGRAVPAALRVDETGGNVQHLDAANPRIRRHRPRRADREPAA